MKLLFIIIILENIKMIGCTCAVVSTTPSMYLLWIILLWRVKWICVNSNVRRIMYDYLQTIEWSKFYVKEILCEMSEAIMWGAK